MFLLIYKGHTAVVLLLFSTLSSVSGSLNNVENKNLTLANIASNCLNIPWIGGLDWVIHSPGSSRGEEVLTFIRGFEAGEEWAMQMLDDLLEMERKIPRDRSQNIRNYDDPVSVKAQYDDNTVHDTHCAMISRDHELLTNGFNSDSSSSLTCDKSTNDESEVTRIVIDTAQSNFLIDESHSAASSNFTMAEMSVISVFLMIGTFLIACTFCDIVRRTGGCGSMSATVITLSKLSLYTNAIAILSTKVTPNMMPAIHGIRCLSCLMIIIGHRYINSLGVFGRKFSLLKFLELKGSWPGLIVMMSPFAVDTFLLISGFFTSYLFFKAVQSGVKINWPSIYLLRYFRITPAVVALMLFAAVLSHRFGSGPLWEAIFANSINHCQETWWFYLLHIQNLMTNGSKCMPHGWYTALDMQLFWISPFILHPLNRWPKFGLRLLISLLVISVVVPVILLALNDYSNVMPRLDMDVAQLADNFENYYMPTYNRAGPYFMGILMGYDVAKKKRHLSQINVAINWLLTGTIMLFCIWSTFYIFHLNFVSHWGVEMVYTALSRPGWSIANAWIIYACTQGYGGLATRFLSLPLFFPLSRLTYSIYLVHYAVQGISMGRANAPIDYLRFEMVIQLCWDVVMSIAMAFVFNLFVESPIIALTKIFVNHSQRKSDPVPASVETEKAETKKLK